MSIPLIPTSTIDFLAKEIIKGLSLTPTDERMNWVTKELKNWLSEDIIGKDEADPKNWRGGVGAMNRSRSRTCRNTFRRKMRIISGLQKESQE